MYTNYCNYINEVCRTGNLSNFKNNSNYTSILEHLSSRQGTLFLDAIREKSSITDEEIKSFSLLNDSVGNPNKSAFGSLFISPSNLRYIYHTHIILKYLGELKLSAVNIVEVGGGYGGLCLAMHHFARFYNININSYTMIDLKDISNLQQQYLAKVNPLIKADFVDAATFGADIKTTNLFLISNYCFSEIDKKAQELYITNLFPKVSHGFLAWNAIPTYNFGFATKIEDEYPKYGDWPFNKYVTF